VAASVNVAYCCTFLYMQHSPVNSSHLKVVSPTGQVAEIIQNRSV